MGLDPGEMILCLLKPYFLPLEGQRLVASGDVGWRGSL